MSNENNLKNQTSPYLLQHADHPVHWYPWCDEAFKRAEKEDKPIFLSIGYSTCHWCHVMAHESFEDDEVAELLNRYFICIKVDKEERPDIDSIYMSVCQAFTGSGGWPTTIFMTYEQKPFYAGTYFPKHTKYGMTGLIELLLTVSEKWNKQKKTLLQAGDEITQALKNEQPGQADVSDALITDAVSIFKNSFDQINGGFGDAPKFPTPHNLMFLMEYYANTKDKEALYIAEKTLLQMYKGGIFDHIGFGFSRYSTDRYFLVPHFEKMLYDNALLIMAYTKAFELTQNTVYKEAAERTADYILRELTDAGGAFYCAQDADSDGVEGKYYVFEYDELINLLGEQIGKQVNDYYDITKEGNFEGRNIPNLLKHTQIDNAFEQYLPKVYAYRASRTKLHLDDKILTAWNGLMIAAFAMMYRVFKKDCYLTAASSAAAFIEQNLMQDNTLFVSFRNHVRSGKGFLDDYAYYIYALIHLYEATLSESYLKKAIQLTQQAVVNFYDEKNHGFFLYGKENEQLILRPKETYDGALPSGNSVMAYNLIKLFELSDMPEFERLAQRQIAFMASYAEPYPAGYSFYLNALSIYMHPPKQIICVLKNPEDRSQIKNKLPVNATVRVTEPTEKYPMINDQTTFYVCENHSCKPPVNDIAFI